MVRESVVKVLNESIVDLDHDLGNDSVANSLDLESDDSSFVVSKINSDCIEDSENNSDE